MPLLGVVKDVCLNVGVAVPTSVFTGITSNRTMQEMVSLANEMAQRISYDTREWTKLRQVGVCTGDGTKQDFDLPQNFKRMILTAEVWRQAYPAAPMRFVPDTNEWVRRRLQGYTDSRGEWTMYGGQIHIVPTLGNGEKASFVYLDKNCVVLNAGGRGTEFATDADSFYIDDRLLKLGMIWQWKAKKGSQYTEDMGTYGDALTIAMGTDLPAPTIVGRAPVSSQINATVAYPWPVPT
jgi:hypothetical protein